MTQGFCSIEHHSQGTFIDVYEQNIRTSDQLLEAIRGVLAEFVKGHGATFRTFVLYFACHALQLDNEIFLIPPGAELTTSSIEAFKSSVPKQCLKLSDVVKACTQIIDDNRKELAARFANSDKTFDLGTCRCIFILDACRDEGFEALEGTKPYAPVTETFLLCNGATFCERLFLFSTSQGKCASDGGAREGHSWYTNALLEILFVPGKLLADVLKAAEAALSPLGQKPTVHGDSLCTQLTSALFEEHAPSPSHTSQEDSALPCQLEVQGQQDDLFDLDLGLQAMIEEGNQFEFVATPNQHTSTQGPQVDLLDIDLEATIVEGDQFDFVVTSTRSIKFESQPKPIPHLLAVFSTDADHNPNVKPELEELEKQMRPEGSINKHDIALVDLRPEKSAIGGLGDATINCNSFASV